MQQLPTQPTNFRCVRLINRLKKQVSVIFHLLFSIQLKLLITLLIKIMAGFEPTFLIINLINHQLTSCIKQEVKNYKNRNFIALTKKLNKWLKMTIFSIYNLVLWLNLLNSQIRFFANFVYFHPKNLIHKCSTCLTLKTL